MDDYVYVTIILLLLVCIVRIIEKNRRDVLYFSKQLSTNIIVKITYDDG